MLEGLPKKINQLTVKVADDDLGLLTHASSYVYQPTQTKHFVSLTMTRPTLESYSSGALHAIFAQNLPEGFNRRYISQRLARYARVDDMYFLALQANEGIGMLSYQSDFNLPHVQSL